MGADNDCPPFAPLTQVMQYLMLSTAINRRQRVVENQDFSVQQQRACNRNALFLPAGEHHATLAHFGVVTLWQTQNIFMHAGQLRRAFNFFLRGARAAQCDIAGHRIGKQERRLADDRQTAAPGIELKLA